MIKLGLKFKIIITVIIFVILTFSVMEIFFYSQQKRILTEELKARGISLARNLAYNCKYGLITEDKIILNQLTYGVIKESDIIYSEIYNENEKIIASSHLEYGSEIAKVQKISDLKAVDIRSNVHNGDYPVFDILIPVFVQGDESSETDWFFDSETEDDNPELKDEHGIRIGTVRLGISTKDTNAKINHNRNLSFLTVALASIVLSYTISVLLSRLVIKPLYKVTQGAEAIAEGKFKYQIDIRTNDEIGQLSYAFNKMANDLDKSITLLKDSEYKLKEYSENLEDMVEKRTNELQEINIKLYQMMEKAKDADRLKSAFLATMSHELRTPLNSIIGFTGIILQGLAGPLNDEQRKQLTMVQNSARHLLDLINDVLDISKIEAGQLEVTKEPFDIREAIEKVVQTVSTMASKKNIILSHEIDSEVEIIESDRRRVEQILLNLVNNAVKFTDRGKIKIECGANGNWLKIQVIDTGIGIKQEDKSKLFETFRQIDTGLSRQREGTGLGLSICKKLVELLGGKIKAESEFGVGSTFSFTLPIETGVKYEYENSYNRG